MNDVAMLMATNSVPQSVNFGIKGDVAASLLRVNGVEPKTIFEAAPAAANSDDREGAHGEDDS